MDATVAAGWIGGGAALVGALVGAGGAVLGGWVQHRQQVATARDDRQEAYARAAGEATLTHLLQLHRSTGDTLQRWDVTAENTGWREDQLHHIREIEMSSYLIPVAELRTRVMEVVALVLFARRDGEQLDQVALMVGISNEGVNLVASYLRGEPLPPRSAAFIRTWNEMPAASGPAARP
jgi:hypothetical protein